MEIDLDRLRGRVLQLSTLSFGISLGLAVIAGLGAFAIGLVRSPLLIAIVLLQATSLPFIVAATAIGLQLGLMKPATDAALVGAGLVSVVAFPLAALTLLKQMGIRADPGRVLKSAKS
ncbi:MAG TPA: hypothetical protein VGR77_03560 [Candidatus Dormibacteraeota bacterium]|nr:hypothetical protein [Candidatus Dormibacteraeota bacterium]